MKKAWILLILGVLPLFVGVSFSASDLSRQLSALTEQILAEAEHPFTQLEELKKLFSHCAEEHTDPVLKTACQSWLDKSYPAIKEFVPQQVFIELGTDDVEVKKIGETSVFFAEANEPEIADHYQLIIPKYQLKLTFPLQKGMIPAQYLSTWQWAKGGLLVIPPYYLGRWNTPGEQIALFHYPYLRSTTDLGEVGKIYRKLYENIFCLKDWKGLLEKKHPNRQEEKGDSVYYQYIVGEGPLMRADYRELQGESWYGLYNTLDAYYGEWGESVHRESIAKGRSPQPSAECRAIHQKKRGKNNRYTLLLWNKKNPQYFSMWMQYQTGTHASLFSL